MRVKSLCMATAAALVLVACGGQGEGAGSQAGPSDSTQTDRAVPDLPDTRTVTLQADANFVTGLQTALITAREGDIIQLPEGVFNLTDGLSLDVDRVTLQGAGEGKTVLSYSDQSGAGEGLLVTSDDVILQDLTIQDTAGDGIKSKGADRIIYRNLTVEWTGEPDESNGAYGVYPVESSDILIEGVTVRGASDAGVYVGQSDNIIVRNSVAEYNVAGIEIENSTNADVYNNRAEHNTGGILVFDLPDLPKVGGHTTRVYDNVIKNNNTRNFAPPGNIVAEVPSGTGVIIMANENVHVFNNEFADNRSAHVLLTAYQSSFADERYNPLPRNISVKGNRYSGGGNDPQGLMQPIGQALGGQLPVIVWDGVTRWNENADIENNIMIEEDTKVSFVNLGIGAYPLEPSKVRPSFERPSGTAIERPAKVVLAHAKGS